MSEALHAAPPYQRAVELEENVQHKLFPKDGKVEISAPTGGFILNQSYVNSALLQGAVSYFVSESWGVGVEGVGVFNSDKDERFCIEHFYNDPDNRVAAACPEPDQDIYTPLLDQNNQPVKGASFGPTYVAIRELEFMAFASLIWNPIYGKQLAFLSFTSYFDIFTTIGIGVAKSTFYPESLNMRNGRPARGPVPADVQGCPASPGICAQDPDVLSQIGEEGRPDPEEHFSQVLTVGIGQKFHFWQNFHLKAELRNFTLFDLDQGVELYYALWAGVGFRF